VLHTPVAPASSFVLLRSTRTPSQGYSSGNSPRNRLEREAPSAERSALGAPRFARFHRGVPMLTPAEELCLSGLSLAGRVRKAFYNIAEPTLVALLQSIREESLRRHLIYLRDGEWDTIRILPCPITALPDQLA